MSRLYFLLESTLPFSFSLSYLPIGLLAVSGFDWSFVLSKVDRISKKVFNLCSRLYSPIRYRVDRHRHRILSRYFTLSKGLSFDKIIFSPCFFFSKVYSFHFYWCGWILANKELKIVKQNRTSTLSEKWFDELMILDLSPNVVLITNITPYHFCQTVDISKLKVWKMVIF